MEKREEQGHFQTHQVIGVTVAVAFEQAVGPKLPQVVAELGQAVALGGQGTGLEHGLVKGGAAMEEDFEPARYAGVLNIQAGDASGSLLHGLGQAVKEGKLDMNVER
jgi:hypothetical protein